VKKLKIPTTFPMKFWTTVRPGAKNESMSKNNPNHSQEPQFRQGTFIPLPSTDVPARPEVCVGRPRMQSPERGQVAFRLASLDALLPEDHQARLVWEYVQRLDLSPLYQKIRAVEGRAGRDPIDPRILMTLWLYATLDGVGSARELARLCVDHHAYQWICGDVSVNHHTLSDFRVSPSEYLDQLLTGSVAALMHQDLVKLVRVAQDGVRVRAGAGSGSFRRKPTLVECRTQAAVQVEILRKELQEDSSATSRRQKAARQRAVRERAERIDRALAEMPQVEADKRRKNKNTNKARVSTTDPEMRVMKMADGGFRPAVNVQFATDTASQIITGVAVTNNGSDGGQMVPMLKQHRDRYGKVASVTLVDGGFATRDDIEQAGGSDLGTVVYAPVQKSRKVGQDPYGPRPDDSPAIIEWRKRMSTPQAKVIYKDRASTAECINAIARNRGLRQFMVRGLKKIRAVTLWFVLAHNLVRAATLKAMATVRAETSPATP
jgi:transposase